MSDAIDEGQRRAHVERSAKEWRSALIDVSGNNRLLHFKPTAATVDLAAAALGPRAELLAGEAVRLSKLFPDPVRLAAVAKAAKALEGKEREATEEYGVSILSVAFGLASWPRHPGDGVDALEAAALADGSAPPSGGGRVRATGPQLAAPVLLRAAALHRLPGTVDSWQLTLTGEAQLNPVLAHVLSGEGAAVDEEQILTAGDDTEGELQPIFDAVANACGDIPGFAIDPRIVLGAFSYLKQPMVNDCGNLDALTGSDLVAALAGDQRAVSRIRTEHGEVSEAGPDYTPVDSEFLVLDADASQSFVVNAALAGRNLVVQGPPGTGKSQTIANVIAALVASGQRVLFVAQKRAAITAVLDRLDGVGLGQLTLDLFAAGASRRYVSEQLSQALDRHMDSLQPDTGRLHRELTQARDTLVGHRDALHTRTHAWGVTVAQLLASAAALPPDVETAYRVPTTVLSGWAPDDLDRHADALEELVDAGVLRPSWPATPGWSTTTLTSTAAVDQANEALSRLIGETLPAAHDAFAALRTELGAVTDQPVVQLAHLVTAAREAAMLTGLVPQLVGEQLDEPTLVQLLAATDADFRKQRQLKVGWLARRRLRARARQLTAAAGQLDDAGLHQLLSRVHVCRSGWGPLGGLGPVRALASLPAAENALAALQADLHVLAPYLQHIQVWALTLAELDKLATRLRADRRLGQFPRLHALGQQLTAAGLNGLLTVLRRDTAVADGAPLTGERAAGMLRYAAVHSALDRALTTDRDLAGVDGASLSRASEVFARRDLEHLQANAARVRRAAAARLTAALNQHQDQHLLIKREATKKRNFRPVRALFEQAPEVMTAVKPVWVMSPLQVSRLLPAQQCFNVVVFDEASQIKPADAIPALLRAGQVIVAGDSRQLPPTDFFTKTLEDPADDLDSLAAAEDAALDGADEEQPAPRPVAESFTRDAESILAAFERVLAGQTRSLQWHYRSRDARLIAVSNEWVYGGSLTTFPSVDGDDAVTHVVVHPSVGPGGKTNSPNAEVETVVELICEHARTRPDESLGVITFGLVHARRIEDALEQALLERPELEAVLNGGAEPLFVKNIERVQGDERDAVVLSVGYGKNASGRLPLFWGPLLRPGGERRLNVAISRARNRMTLVSSFAADDVAEDAHPSAGFTLMHRFLHFAASGGRVLSRDGIRAVPLNPFEQDIFTHLTAAGLDLVPQLGVGQYRLDFAARHPDRPGRYVLAIEADGASYHSGHIARERDRLRRQLLEARGWVFHRIWSTDWFNDPQAQVQAAVAAYYAALAELRQREHSDTTPGTGRQAAAAGGTPTEAATVSGTPATTNDLDADEQPAWHMPSATRTLPRPRLQPGQPIGKYPMRDLVALVRHVRSDGVLRTRDDEITVLMAELGFRKRGSSIMAALTEAQNLAGPALH